MAGPAQNSPRPVDRHPFRLPAPPAARPGIALGPGASLPRTRLHEPPPRWHTGPRPSSIPGSSRGSGAPTPGPPDIPRPSCAQHPQGCLRDPTPPVNGVFPRECLTALRLPLSPRPPGRPGFPARERPLSHVSGPATRLMASPWSGGVSVRSRLVYPQDGAHLPPRGELRRGRRGSPRTTAAQAPAGVPSERGTPSACICLSETVRTSRKDAVAPRGPPGGTPGRPDAHQVLTQEIGELGLGGASPFFRKQHLAARAC